MSEVEYMRECGKKKKFLWFLFFILLFGGLSVQLGGSAQSFRHGIIAAIYLGVLIVAIMRLRSFVYVMRLLWPVTLLTLYTIASSLWSSSFYGALQFSVHMAFLILIVHSVVLASEKNVYVLYKTVFIASVFVTFLSCVTALIYPEYGIATYGTYEVGVLVDRWNGITSHPNTLGAYSIISIWSGCLLYIDAGRKYRLIILVCLIFSFLIVLLGAQSMTSVGICVGIIVLSISVKKDHFLPIKVTLVLTCCSLILILISQFVLHMMNRDPTFSGRTELWGMAFDAFLGRPYLGWGVGGIVDYSYYLKGVFKYSSFHNGYLQIMVNGGIVALILFVMSLISMFKSVLLSAQMDRKLSYSMYTILLAACLQNMMESTFFTPLNPVWMVLMSMWSYTLFSVRPNASKHKS